MAYKYVNFISDEHFLTCVDNLHKSYLNAKNNISKKSFYTNKVDTIKLTFDAKFNDIKEDDLIQSEGGKSFEHENEAAEFVLFLLNNEEELKRMSENAGNFVAEQPNSSELILKKILSL